MQKWKTSCKHEDCVVDGCDTLDQTKYGAGIMNLRKVDASHDCMATLWIAIPLS